MLLVQAIRQILRPALIQSGPIELREEDQGSTCSPVTLRRRGPAVALRPDRIDCKGLAMNDRFFPWFNTGAPGFSRLCDYIVFQPGGAPGPAQLFVFLCELKSRNCRGAREQVANGRLLADYLIRMARHHAEVIENPDIKYRALIFGAGLKNPKGSLQPGRFRYPDTLERMIDVPVAYFACGADLPLSILCA